MKMLLKETETYESELHELQDWMREETKRYFAEVGLRIKNGTICRDGDENYRFKHETIPTYNKKLKELKRKYNIPEKSK